MAKTAEDFASELLMPIFAIGVGIFFLQKILQWAWEVAAPHAIPILWVTGVLFLIGIICFVLFMRTGLYRKASKSFVFSLGCLGVFGLVVYYGSNDKLLWAQQIIESIHWIIENPIVTCIIIFVILILAVTIPIPGWGPVWMNKVKSEFQRGMEEGMRNTENDS